MNFDNLKEASGRFLSNGVLQVQKYAPEILTGIGIVGVVVAAVWVAKSTLELDEALEPSRQLVEGHKKLRAEKSEEEYPESVYRRDLAISYFRGAQAVTKLYGVPVLLGVASLGCFVASTGILKERNASVVAAYGVLDASFKAYRARVIEEFGVEKDWDIRHGVREEIEETVSASGKVTKKKVKRSSGGLSPYSVNFDSDNKNWERSPDLNLFFLKRQERFANDRLRAYGHLFLNDVYRALGFNDTKEGAVVGWVYEGGEGDGYVSFGIWDYDVPCERDFSNGFDKGVVLDFNVDGVVLDYI